MISGGNFKMVARFCFEMQPPRNQIPGFAKEEK